MENRMVCEDDLQRDPDEVEWRKINQDLLLSIVGFFDEEKEKN